MLVVVLHRFGVVLHGDVHVPAGHVPPLAPGLAHRPDGCAPDFLCFIVPGLEIRPQGLRSRR